MNPKSSPRWRLLVVGLVLVTISIWGIVRAQSGLRVENWRGQDGTPLTAFYPHDGNPAERPLVLVGHGFAGSQQVMRGFALTLAKAGFCVITWDFVGHGANPHGLSTEGLDNNAERALAEATLKRLGNPAHTAIMGHSMGSGVALRFGQNFPATDATIAISPVGQAVTPELPHNLLLLVGEWESAFVSNAEERLVEAGGAGGDTAEGTARALVIIPFVEHVSILFSPVAHAVSRDWLEATFGVQPGEQPYTDLRMIWYGLGMLGTFLVIGGLAPLARLDTQLAVSRPFTFRWLLSLLGGAMGATLLLGLVNTLGVQLSELFGLLVGGYLLVWFGLAGLIAWLLSGTRPSRPNLRNLLGGLLVFLALWLGVGLLGHYVWQPWLLIPRRLLLWPLGTALLLPWFLAYGEALSGAGWTRQLGWWICHSIITISTQLLALVLIPDMGFIMIILPLFPIILGIHTLAAYSLRGGWAYGISGAMFVSWLLLAVFPLA